MPLGTTGGALQGAPRLEWRSERFLDTLAKWFFRWIVAAEVAFELSPQPR
jgi:hypothetical protein